MCIRENMCCSPITSNASLLRHRNSLIQPFSSAVILILNTYIIDVHQMFGTSLQTWKDLSISGQKCHSQFSYTRTKHYKDLRLLPQIPLRLL